MNECISILCITQEHFNRMTAASVLLGDNQANLPVPVVLLCMSAVKKKIITLTW